MEIKKYQVPSKVSPEVKKQKIEKMKNDYCNDLLVKPKDIIELEIHDTIVIKENNIKNIIIEQIESKEVREKVVFDVTDFLC